MRLTAEKGKEVGSLSKHRNRRGREYFEQTRLDEEEQQAKAEVNHISSDAFERARQAACAWRPPKSDKPFWTIESELRGT